MRTLRAYKIWPEPEYWVYWPSAKTRAHDISDSPRDFVLIPWMPSSLATHYLSLELELAAYTVSYEEFTNTECVYADDNCIQNLVYKNFKIKRRYIYTVGVQFHLVWHGHPIHLSKQIGRNTVETNLCWVLPIPRGHRCHAATHALNYQRNQVLKRAQH